MMKIDPITARAAYIEQYGEIEDDEYSEHYGAFLTGYVKGWQAREEAARRITTIQRIRLMIAGAMAEVGLKEENRGE